MDGVGKRHSGLTLTLILTLTLTLTLTLILTLTLRVTFRNVELDVDAFEADDMPDLASSLDLAELAIGALGQAIQDMIGYHGFAIDDMLEEDRQKRMAD